METDAPKIFESLRSLVERAGVVSPEKTLFSLAGRGHYENPLSDLLAFFLKPDEGHGLGTLFLSVLMGTVDLDSELIAYGPVSVMREFPIEGGRLDIVVVGHDWGILMETKVRADLYNDLDTYERGLRSGFPNVSWKYVLLSPRDGRPGEKSNWKWRSLGYLSGRIGKALDSIKRVQEASKWVVFARELCLHMNELQGENMTITEEQARSVEENLLTIKAAQNLLRGYNAFLIGEINSRLSKAVPGIAFDFKDVGWAFRYSDVTGKLWMLMLETPGQGGDGTRKQFYAGIWVVNGSSS
ncbi:PD-(D/E)XK nuclease family protein [Verrucomicrobium spinosum]|uniref:PD-(D/E)XK nuclease family protein n=1 Tax=Verrucomicrobium spinosum TaxID=2736 RepID=UPI0009466271|nr:PD-(D/E)XK nuclease family protein [Verrucomicrobium spinosum]